MEAMRMAVTSNSLDAPGGLQGGGHRPLDSTFVAQPKPAPKAAAEQYVRPSQLQGVDIGTAQSVFEAPLTVQGDPDTVKAKAREWQFQLRVEAKRMDMEAKRIRVEEKKLRQKISTRAQRGHSQDVQALAAALVESRKAASRLDGARAALEACGLQLGTALAAISAAGALRLSTETVRGLSQFAGAPEAGQALKAVSADMARCTGLQSAVAAAASGTLVHSHATVDEVERVIDEINLEARLAQSGASQPMTMVNVASSQPVGSATSTVMNADSAATTMVDMGRPPAHRPAPAGAGTRVLSGSPPYTTQPHLAYKTIPNLA